MIKMTEDQEMFLKILREFIDQEVKPKMKELNLVDEYPLWIKDRMTELGFNKLLIPEEYGGVGESFTTLMILGMEAAKYNNTFANITTSSFTVVKLLKIGNKQQIDAFLPGMLEKGLYGGMAYTEAEAGSDARGIKTTAVLDGDEWVLNGTKCFISYRKAIGFWQVSAKTIDENGVEGISAFYVDANAPGLSYGEHYKKFGWAGSDSGDLYLKNCRVPKWALIGEVNKGLRVALSTLDASRLIVGARTVGYAKGAFEQAFEYAKNRVQFGKPICENQTIQHYFADMITDIEVGENYVLSMAEKIDAGQSLGKGGSITKLFCSEMAKRVCDKAISICGGMGLLDDYGISRFYKDARVATITDGTTEIQKNIIYKSLTKEY